MDGGEPLMAMVLRIQTADRHCVGLFLSGRLMSGTDSRPAALA